MKNVSHVQLIALATLAFASNANSEQFLFSKQSEYQHWYPMTDRVMGGRSLSAFVPADGYAVFRGFLSLENNGGFALATRYPVMVQRNDKRSMTLISRGDGRRYQLRLGLNDRRGGVAYTASFQSSDNEWQTMQFDIDDFVPMYRGRKLPLPRLDNFQQVRQVGIMISDKREGPFELHIADIALTASGKL